MEGVKGVPPGHIDVHQVSIEGAEGVAGRRGVDDHDSGLSGLRVTFGDGVKL